MFTINFFFLEICALGESICWGGHYFLANAVAVVEKSSVILVFL